MVDFNRRTFALEHPDINHSNIFVTDDLIINCIIDWEYASTVPWETFCVPPHLPGRRDPMRVELRNDFEDVIRILEQLDNTRPRILCTSCRRIRPDQSRRRSIILRVAESIRAFVGL